MKRFKYVLQPVVIFYQPVFFIVVMLLTACNKPEQQQKELVDGTEIIVPNKLYVVHSMIYANEKPWTTSNIFVIKGTGDTVWIYGSGYGDFTTPCEDSCNDNNYYLGKEFHGTGPAIKDVQLVNEVIENEFQLVPEQVILQFIVPHYHNDHINAEFVESFFNDFKYSFFRSPVIWIHTNDYYGATCNEPCCGTEPCPEKENKYYGVPYLPSWKEKYLAIFRTMGNENDACNQIVKTFTSASGEWTISKAVAVKDKGHTDGTVNLNNENLQLRITGTKSKYQCPLPDGWRFVTVHDNLNMNDE